MQSYEQRTIDRIDYLTPTSPEWPAMWEALADAAGDYADCCPETGECWQYMGSVGDVHQFRHRHRPATARPIKGFAGQHRDRVYLDLDHATLKVVRVNVQRYQDDKPSDYVHAGGKPTRKDFKVCPFCKSRSCPGACGCPSYANEDFDVCQRHNRREDYSGAFDGFTVTSDADPGL